MRLILRNDDSRELIQLLDQWKALTEAEHEAILSEDWVRMEQVQSQKAASQKSIEASHAKLLQRVPRSQRTAIEDELGLVARELLNLESRNRDLLSEKLAETNAELKQLNKTTQSIRHVQRAYGTADRSFWQAYS